VASLSAARAMPVIDNPITPTAKRNAEKILLARIISPNL
jgi:hypothetical protein